MSNWKIALDAPVKETTASTSTGIGRERPLPREMVERIGLKLPDFGSRERDEIKRRVQKFRALQQRLIREREEYAASILSKMRSS